MFKKIFNIIKKNGFLHLAKLAIKSYQSRYGFVFRKLHYKYDGPQQKRLAETEINDPYLKDLFLQGFVNLGKCENSVRQYFDQIRHDLDNEQDLAPNSFIVRFNNPLLKYPGLLEIINNEKIIAIVRSYLGDDAIFDSLQIWRTISGRDDPSKASAGQWHHDRVGNRLKLFVFLSDTTINTGQYTLYAKGSNQVMWNTFRNYTRKNWAIKVPDQFEVIQIRANMGEMVIFDTNGLHSGVYNKSLISSRDIVQFDFSSRAKSKDMPSWSNLGPRGLLFTENTLNLLKKNPLFDFTDVTQLDSLLYRYGRELKY